MADVSNANDILLDFDGKLAYVTDNDLYVYEQNNLELATGVLISSDSDLGEPSIDKLMNSIDVDYVGAFNLSLYFDGVYEVTLPLLLKATRGTVWLNIPLINRKPFQKFKYIIAEPAVNTKVYGLEIDFSILKRRRVS